MDPFKALGITPHFVLNAGELRKSFIAIQKNVHPDFSQENTGSSELANQAYELLKKREGAVKAFVCLYKEEKELNANQLPADFLMEMMDLSDEIEASQMGEDSNKSMVEQQLIRWDEELMSELMALSENYSVNEMGEKPSNDLLEKLIIWYQKSKYIARLRKNFLGIEEM